MSNTAASCELVVQHKHGLAGRCFNYDSCENLLKSDPLIIQFIQATLQAH